MRIIIWLTFESMHLLSYMATHAGRVNSREVTMALRTLALVRYSVFHVYLRQLSPACGLGVAQICAWKKFQTV